MRLKYRNYPLLLRKLFDHGRCSLKDKLFANRVESRSKEMVARNFPLLAPLLSTAFEATLSQGGQFGGWALEKAALRLFTAEVLSAYRAQEVNRPLSIVEFGSGQATVFWSQLSGICDLDCDIRSFEHDSDWARRVRELVDDSSVRIFERGLKQLSDAEVASMKDVSSGSTLSTWSKLGHTIPLSESRNTRIKNCFYSIQEEDFENLVVIDGLVVDGPHGNGRFLGFILTSELLRENSLVLIDDFNHYSFMQEFARLYRYEEVYRSTLSGKSWIILRVVERQANKY